MALRAPTEADAERVLALLAARDTVDLGAPDYTLEDLLAEWRMSDFDLARDAVLHETEQGEIAGYARVRRPGTFAAVHPGHEGEGIGSTLLDWTERRERELGLEGHRTATAASNARAVELLTSRGYSATRSFWRMGLALASASLPPEQEIAGVSFRALDAERDGEAIYALDRLAFASVGGTEPESLAAFTEEHLQSHDLAPTVSTVAERSGAPIAFLLAQRWESESVGYVSILAVTPEEQGRGIGRALLRRAFVAMAAEGLDEARLGVAADNPKALRLYEGLGMRPRFSIVVFERPSVL